jgi:hypothetical protein
MASERQEAKREKLVSSLRQIETLVAECLAAADQIPSVRIARPKKIDQREKQQGATQKPDFTLPLRPFVNKHARNMSGPEKFALVLAHMTKGKTGVQVELATITKAWSKMTALLDDFNLAYTTRAKDKGWVDSPKKKFYALLPGWVEILDAE